MIAGFDAGALDDLDPILNSVEISQRVIWDRGPLGRGSSVLRDLYWPFLGESHWSGLVSSPFQVVENVHGTSIRRALRGRILGRLGLLSSGLFRGWKVRLDECLELCVVFSGESFAWPGPGPDWPAPHRVILVAWDQMPVQMCLSIPKKLIVQPVRVQGFGKGRRDSQHIVQELFP